ncbi:hypothetical protein [Morganella morganii]|uniref:hypothetical protein n=1 Tax=Morganella morganii TaxID=582 RepID=UPI003EBE5002
MSYIYYVIFGETWGSGHLSRAVHFKNSLPQSEVTIVIHFEKPSDIIIANNYLKTPYHEPVIKNSQNKILINDTLGKFTLPGKYKEVWLLDSLEERPCKANFKKYHILYPTIGSTDFPFKKHTMPKKKTSALIVQGGGDDHKKIPEILLEIPEEIYTWVCIGNNCRYINELSEVIKKRDNSTLLIDVPILQILPSSDYIITAAGNTLLEIMENSNNKKIIIFTREEKEMQTANMFSNHKDVLKIFGLTENFRWIKND